MVAACLLLVIAVQSQAAEKPQPETEPPRKSPTGALLRSMVVPGWGQVYNGKYLKAVVYAGAQLSFLYGAHIQNNRYHEYQNLGDDVVAEFYKDDRNRLLWWLFGITLLSMGDAFVDAHLWRFDVSDDLSAYLTPQVDPNRVTVRLSLTFLIDR